MDKLGWTSSKIIYYPCSVSFNLIELENVWSKAFVNFSLYIQKFYNSTNPLQARSDKSKIQQRTNVQTRAHIQKTFAGVPMFWDRLSWCLYLIRKANYLILGLCTRSSYFYVINFHFHCKKLSTRFSLSTQNYMSFRFWLDRLFLSHADFGTDVWDIFDKRWGWHPPPPHHTHTP